MKVRLSLILTVAALVAATAACSRATPQDDGRLRVVSTFFPLHEAVRAIGGERVSAANLTPPGAEPHDLELTTAQIDEALGADLLVTMGGGFEGGVLDRLGSREGPVLEVLPAVEGDEDDASGDPHIWLDPRLFSIAAAEIAEAIIRLDSAGGSTYRGRLRAFQERLGELDAAYRDGLRDCERDLVVTTHDAFGRLGTAFGLRVEAIAGISPEAEPDPARLAELTELVRREGVTTIFTEPLVSPEVAETLARETGTRIAVLNPVEGLTPEQAERGETYFSLMEANLEELREALGCDS